MCLPSADPHANRTPKTLETSRSGPSFQPAQHFAGLGVAPVAAFLEELAAALRVDPAVEEQVALSGASVRHPGVAGAREGHGGAHRVLRGGIEVSKDGAAEGIAQVA